MRLVPDEEETVEPGPPALWHHEGLEYVKPGLQLGLRYVTYMYIQNKYKGNVFICIRMYIYVYIIYTRIYIYVYVYIYIYITYRERGL